MSGTRIRHLPLQAYLLTLMLVASILVTGLTVYQQQQRLDRSRAVATDSMAFIAELGAADIVEAVEGARNTTEQLAANPGLTALFETPTPEGCTLDFTGAGPFTEGRIDIIDRAGKVLCSSRERPRGSPYRGESWLDSTEPGVVGPVESATGPALVAVSPINDLGVVAVILDLAVVPRALENQYGVERSARFEVLLQDADPITQRRIADDAIVGDAAVDTLGWTVRAGVGEDEALGYARELNREITVTLVIGLALVLALVELIYLGIARPIRRLSNAVRGATSSGATVAPPTSGPAEVVSLGEDFVTLTQNVATELAHRQRAQDEARASEQTYRTMFEANPHPTWVHHAETGQLLAVNAAMVERFGWTREQLLTMNYDQLLEDHERLKEKLAGDGLVRGSGPWTLSAREGNRLECLITSDVLQLPGAPGRIVVAEDVTAQRHTERLLQRTQRMESLGQLAGGIAHDFNNVLAVMLNYADFAAQELTEAAEQDPDRWGPVLADVREIGAAGDRAATLTRQLLSFARGDALETGAVNINDVATGVEHLLRRTLGEQVTLNFALDPDVWPVEANVGQLEQVIVNLAVNARDAMPTGGELSIETMNVDVDEEYTATRPERAPGRYVRLRVSDTGVGMDAAARDRAFEPFFTTKDRATGTGLGLATVYGVVKRAGGTVDIYSEPGLGTTISMFLPAAARSVEAAPAQAPSSERTGGSETVLLVEDDEALRGLAERILRGDGYRVLLAEDGPRAEILAADHRGQVDLLVTDVVMPGMLGSELAVRVTEADPTVRVLFMSGYAPPVLINGGTLPFNAVMVDKPFSADLLLGKVREVLDADPSRHA